MRVLVIVDTYVPARISGALQMRDLCRELVSQGHTPTVIVPAPDQSQPWLIERLDGVEVLRVRTLQTKDVGMVRRGLSECLLPFSMLLGLSRSPLAKVRWDGVVWYSPTIFFGPMVRWLKRRSGSRGYLILRDLFPDWAVDAGLMRKGAVYRFFKWVERYQYASADVIGVQTPANLGFVQVDSRGGARIEVLNNWLAAPALLPAGINLADSPLAGRTIFVYTGNMGAAQGMDCLIDLATALRSRADVGFLFVGRGSEVGRLRGVAAARGLDRVVFLDEIDSDRIPGLLAQCHVGLIALDPRHTTHNIPGKLLTYLHAGLPVLARINVGNDLEGLIHSEGIGHVVAGDDALQLRNYAQSLADSPEARTEMSRRGLVTARRLFSPAAVVRQVVQGLAVEG